MVNEIRKSVNEIIYERTSSPFFGTLLISWLIWNWKILYLTFFISESTIKTNKIDFIVSNYSDVNHVLVLPMLSALILITIVPFLSNGAYWLSLTFNKWRIDQKNIIDKKQLLSIEQSIELREEISKQEERFAKFIENKNLEISNLNIQIDEYKKKLSRISLSSAKVKDVQNPYQDEFKSLAQRIKANGNEMKQYELVLEMIQNGYSLVENSNISSKIIALLESYDIIENKGNGKFSFTTFGKKFQKEMLGQSV